MSRQRRRVRIVSATTVIGALCGVGIGVAVVGDTARYEATATVAIVPAPGLPEDLAADFWQVLSEEQVVRTAATIYGNGQWADEAAAGLGVPGSDIAVSSSAVVDTTLVRVSVESGSAATAEAALSSVLDSAGAAAAEILQPFVISRASVQPAEAAGPAVASQLIGVSAVAGALAGAGAGLILAGLRRRGRREQDSGPDGLGPVESRPVASGPDEAGPDGSGPDEPGPDEGGPGEPGDDSWVHPGAHSGNRSAPGSGDAGGDGATSGRHSVENDRVPG